MKVINKVIILVSVLAVISVVSLHAEKRKGEVRAPQPKATNSKCLPAANSNELTINNVRAYLETNGTMWFKEIAEYEVPKGSGKTSMFCAALWIGGRDASNQLKLAAVRFRQVGDDFWTGPLSLVDATVSQATCSKYDRFYKITRAEVEQHIAAFETGTKDPDYVIPENIMNWPAHGDVSLGQSRYLAPFKDVDGDGEYTPENGDYPEYDLNNDYCPWTEANKERAKAPTGSAAGLPMPAEWWQYQGQKKVDGMIYADHVLKGDETLFWIFNDMGNTHTETQGEQIGLEIRGQAFAFATNDELNNMTFYSYEIINRSSYKLTNTYFSQWVDPDLGYAQDDYVGCDVARGLGYCYNGKEVDGTGQLWAYGAQPPAVGVDFFQGPYIDADGEDNPAFDNDSARTIGLAYCSKFNVSMTDIKMPGAINQMAINGVNFGDGIKDNERFGMRRFVYHNNDGSVTGDPSVAYQYYNMLQGIWRDNSKMKYGGNAHSSAGGTGPDCDFMFPSTTDLCNWGTHGEVINHSDYGSGGWREENVPNAPADRRFMQSAGPFTLESGAVNYITVGIPWARATQGGAWASVELLKIADDKCQSLFENCFKVLDGPDAPDVTVRELENEIVLYLSNGKTSNNHRYTEEDYEEPDNTIPQERTVMESVVNEYTVVDSIKTDPITGDTLKYYTHQESVTTSVPVQKKNDNYYRFEGYIVYQLKSNDVSVTDLTNQDKARVVAQCDIENYRPDGTAIGKLINYIYDESLMVTVPTEMVDGANAGIFHSISLKEDAFAEEAKQLVNHKTYYYMVLAYAYNEYAVYKQDEPTQVDGQKIPFLAGRKNIQVYSAIPHNPAPQNNGTILHSQYGTQPNITRVEGHGNGGYYLDMTKESRDAIRDNNKVDAITYEKNYGPIGIKVVDPLRVKPFDFEIKFYNGSESTSEVVDSTRWVMSIVNADDAEIIAAGLQDEKTKLPIRTFDSEQTISVHNEQLIMELGLSVSINNYPFQIHQQDLKEQVFASASDYNYRNITTYAQVDFVGSKMEADGAVWLDGIADTESDVPDNWIRAGQYNAGQWVNATNPVSANYNLWRTEDFFTQFAMMGGDHTSSLPARGYKDPTAKFEKAVNGTWAPYVLASPYYGGPQAKYITPDNFLGTTVPQNSYYDFVTADNETHRPFTSNANGFNQTMTNLYSVDIVFTSNKDHWTRCVVLEACDDDALSEGNAKRLEPRKAPSVGKDGKPDGTGTGMGWFPGYAINVETGERLNIMFAENSADTANNGNDMLFNPTDVYATLGSGDKKTYLTADEYNLVFTNMKANKGSIEYVCNEGYPAWGGKHFVYVCGSSGNTNPDYYKKGTQFLNMTRNYNTTYDCPMYDEGQWLKSRFDALPTSESDPRRRSKMNIFNNVMWTSIPIPAFGYDEIDPQNIPNDLTVKLRVSRPYMRYNSRMPLDGETMENTNRNNGFPMYSFSTKNIAPETNARAAHVEIMQDINIVPNPYYGFSTYEQTALENYVRIVNLPEQCNISIFTVNGILVRTISKGDAGSTSVLWDLKNNAGIPISGGLYIIHVTAPYMRGERTLKFFCAMRPADLNSF
ncbi:MAG: hypothetical protein LBR51_07515 [Bacteroidales bacterium]|jgi:hypothetical protein|nr:hypothetical protein [Bacteroidales bacterium]